MRGSIEAMEIVLEANRRCGKKEYDQALPLCEQVISSYPETGAVPPALRLKGDILVRLKRRDEARSAYLGALQKLGTTSRSSRLFRDTRLELRALLMERLSTRLRQGEPVPAAEWNELREVCLAIVNEDGWISGRTRGYLTLAGMYSWKGEPQQSLAAAQEVMRVCQDYPGSFKGQLAWTRKGVKGG